MPTLAHAIPPVIYLKRIFHFSKHLGDRHVGTALPLRIAGAYVRPDPISGVPAITAPLQTDLRLPVSLKKHKCRCFAFGRAPPMVASRQLGGQYLATLATANYHHGHHQPCAAGSILDLHKQMAANSEHSINFLPS